MHDEFVGHGAMSRVNYFVYSIQAYSFTLHAHANIIYRRTQISNNIRNDQLYKHSPKPLHQ